MTDAPPHPTDDASSDRIATPDAPRVEGDHARRAAPLGEHKHDHLTDNPSDAEDRQEALLDEGVEETFPASDPVSAKRIT